MKRLPYILFLALIYFAFCSKSCVDDSDRNVWQEKVAKVTKDSIRNEFEAGYLTEEARFAAEVTAIQKLKDLSDYIKIYSDVSLDTVFREKAGEITRNLFVSENSKLSFGPMKKDKMKPVTLGVYLKKGFGEDILRGEVIFDSIRVLEPMQKSSEGSYSGKLAAYQTVIIYPSIDSILLPSIPVTINFISSKKNKIIGSDTLSVWVVSLGDMDY